MDTLKYDYITATVAIAVNETVDIEKVSVPDGTVVAIGAIVAGDTENRIINLAILQNNTEVVRSADVRFSQKTSGGTFRDSMRPVDLAGGRTYEVRIAANQGSATQAIQVQVLFMVEKPNQNQY